MTAETASFSLAAPTRWASRRLALSLALVAIGDWLFVRDAFPGLSLAIFLLACGLTALLANPLRASRPLRIAVSAAFLLGLLAVVEDLSWLSFLVALAATLLFALTMVFGDFRGWPRLTLRALGLPFVGGVWLVGDLLRVRRLRLRKPQTLWRIASMATWVAPIALSLVFVSLFASVNPLIENWVRFFDPRRLLALLSPGRMALWLLIVCLVWPFVHLRRARRKAKSTRAVYSGNAGDMELLFGKAAVLRSLVLFNALFATQTMLDVAYLWGGLALPEGMTYAAYAHRGAYPLVATALLAAAFVLVAMRPGGPAAASRWVKPLVLIWTAQNFLLVISSLFRNGLYVAAYSLSGLRLAAMIWMGLVAAGLVLIVLQIISGKTNRWLLNANALTAAAVLYACCFVNFPYVVAAYNVAHCREMTGQGPALDIYYLAALGAQALPAYDDALKSDAVRANLAGPNRHMAARRNDARAHAIDSLAAMGWANWSFRAWRLKRYFDTNPNVAAPSGGGATGNP